MIMRTSKLDSEDDRQYVFGLFNSILLLLLFSLIGCVIAVWFINYEASFAIANTGASVGVALAAISARSAEGVIDRSLVIVGMLCAVGFQIWSMAVA